MSSAEHGAPSGAEQGQDRPDHQQDDPQNQQNRVVEQKPHHEQDDAKSDHRRLRYRTDPSRSWVADTHGSRVERDEVEQCSSGSAWPCRR
jgi:hypothetical protein